MDVRQEVDALLERISGLLQEHKFPEDELKDIANSLEGLPFQVRLTQKWGDLLLRAERPLEALEAYEKVGNYYKDNEMWAKAVATLRHAVKLDENRWELRKSLAEAYLEEERRADAVEEYRWVSRIFHQAGDLERAAEFRYKVVEIQPDNIVQKVKLAEILLKIERLRDACEQFEQALELLEENGYWSDLLKVAERLLYVSPAHLYALKLSARIYLENNEALKALVKLKEAFRQAPEDPQVLRLLAVAFDKIEQPNKTLSVLHKLANVYQEQGKLSLARDVFSEILELDPTDSVSQASLMELNAVVGEGDDSSSPVEESKESSSSSPTTPHLTFITPVRRDEIRKQLQHCNLEFAAVEAVALEYIESRPAPAGHKLTSWPDSVRRHVHGELLYGGRYVLTDMLRRDVFGTFFRAIDLEEPTQFVSLLRPNTTSSEAHRQNERLQRLQAEVQRLNDFSHPHLLPLIAIGECEGGDPYIVSEYFDGTPIANVRDALSPLQLFELFYQMVHTIDYMHSRGLVHGNLSPHYVLLNKKGELMIDGYAWHTLLADDVKGGNIAAVDSPSSYALPVFSLPEFVGTSGFVAPEVVDGEKPGRAADIFALGCMLYYMAQHRRIPWTVQRKLGDVVVDHVTRAQDDTVPTLQLGEAPHSQFLEHLFPRLVNFNPGDRLNLRKIQLEYTKFTEKSEHPTFRQTAEHDTDGHFPPHLLTTGSSMELDPVVQLPNECRELPLPIQQSLQQFLSRIKQLSWFQPSEDAVQRGVEHLREYIRRISPFATAPILPQISLVRTRWAVLQDHLVEQQALEPLVREAVDSALADNPNAWAIAGKAAWDAIHAYEVPHNRLLSFDVAAATVSASAWSVSWNPVWVAARSTAWNTSKALAKAAGRTAAWKAAKGVAWTSTWPIAKTVAPTSMRTVARTASGDASWCAAWIVASDQLSDQKNPFESLFAVWELGLYPMLLYNGNYVLVAIDSSVGNKFEVETLNI